MDDRSLQAPHTLAPPQLQSGRRRPHQRLVAGHLSAALTVLLGFGLVGCSGSGATTVGDDPQGARGNVTRVAFGSCAHQSHPQPIWSAVVDTAPDFFVFMGDNVYGDVTTNDPQMNELRVAYDTMAANPDFAAARQALTIHPIWDDHDYGKNDAGGDFALRAQSKDIFREFWQIPDHDPRASRQGLYHAWIEGKPGNRLQVILLDTRSFRSELTPTDEPDAPGKQRFMPEPDPSRTMLGEAQWTWLEAQLRKPAEVRLLVSSVQVIAEGHGFERWGNLPTERQRLYDLLTRTQAAGVIMLSGDRHLGAIYRQDNHPYPLYEVTSSSLNRPLNRQIDEPGPNRQGEVFTKENFGLLTIDWQKAVVLMELRGVDGKVVRTQTASLLDLAPGR